MARRGRGRTLEEEESYEEEQYRLRPPRDHPRDHRERIFEEDVEYRRRPVNARFREVDKDIYKERIRSSSAGPLILRKRVSDEFVHVPRDVERERDEVRIRRREHRSPPVSFEFDERIVHKRGKSRPREHTFRREEDEVVIRERDYDSDNFSRRPRQRPTGHLHEIDVEIDHGRHKDEILYRNISRERPRPKLDEREDIFIHHEDRRAGRGRQLEKDEVIIRRNVDRSSSRESSIAPQRSIHAPPIHQDVITHHRHIEHGRRGRGIDDLEIIHRRGNDYKSPPPARPRFEDRDQVMTSHTTTRGSGQERDRDVLVVRDRDHHHDSRDRADIAAEADYYNRRATAGSSIGEAYNGATQDWSIIDVPPGTKRVTLDGVGGASQEISWQRYNGVRRSKFNVEGDEYSSEYDKAGIGKRYMGVKNRKDKLWTEITKDLVIEEALEKAGYEYEETEHFFYVFSYLRYDDVAHLVRISEDFRRARRERIREIQAERAIKTQPLALPAPHQHSTTVLIDRTTREVEEECYSDDEVVLEPGRRTYRGRRW
ncbi:predicted protein [Uncinocarpus reesii 1704]|uniref:DUF8035 domain-containing protein n=1 Tax=Uncinocarpus reesii (strain UAMH 1704) TaxID=336963 RepID=C4JLN8_UNCRE|nr:uncharacterized protein UREG_03746 [Uncinocarpus reesii 1704]EEP78900.1 predicted protein [Uncinocarpus reesii 1704]